jgi:MFS family permease
LNDATITSPPETGTTNRLLPILLAMAMFVLVVDTSIMNVSISAVVADLGTDVSAIQAAIALEALVSAAFILIGSKIGDLFGRKRAYVLGLLAYAIGALAMASGPWWVASARRSCCPRCSRSSTATSKGRPRRRHTPSWARPQLSQPPWDP